MEVHWTWGYTDTPMGYSHSDYSFDRFDRDTLQRVYISRFLNSSLYNLYLAKSVFEAGGTSWETSPSNFQVDYDTSMGVLLQGLSDLSDGRPSGYEGILTDFILAHETSVNLLEKIVPDNGGSSGKGGFDLSQWLMPISLGVIFVFGLIIYYKKKRDELGYQKLQGTFPTTKKILSTRPSRRGRGGSAYKRKKSR